MKKIKRIIKSIRLYFLTKRFARHYAKVIVMLYKMERGGE